MPNPNLSKLDLNQALHRTIDANDDAMRVIVGAGTDFSIELSADDGDSVAVRSIVTSASGELTTSSSGSVVSAVNVEGAKDLQVLVKINTAISGSATIQLQVSPAFSGSTWLDVGSSMTVTGSTDLVGTISNVIARRARVQITSNSITAGSARVYMMSRG